MKVLLKVNLILITLLSMATGIFKILQQPADIELFAAIGFTAMATTAFGVAQLIGGILLLLQRFRIIGAWIMLPTFIIATVAVFMNQLVVFGIVSMLFILMTIVVLKSEKKLGN